jgi:putative transposase
VSEGFRIVGPQARRIEQLNRRWSRIRIPKVGWVRLRRSRGIPDAASYRVTRDADGRWHVAFAAIPAPIPAPGNGRSVGVDRGVRITAALSDGRALSCPQLTARERARLRKAERRKARAPKKSAHLAAERAKIAALKARERDLRRDWCEKTSTDLAREFDLIRLEDLRIKDMTRSAKGTVEVPGRNVGQKAGLNRAILAQGWGLLAQRIGHKAGGRTEKVPAKYTSLRCSDCGWIDKNSRQSQAAFCCTFCGFTLNADYNAALNIAAGQVRVADPRQAPRAGGTTRRTASSVREPQHAPPQVA